MSKIEIKSLEDIPFETVHAAWVRGFSDYAVNIKLTLEDLRIFLKRNGVSFKHSVGAFDGNDMIGFWINGVRKLDGILCAYDSGTAIVPEYRNRGISKQLSLASDELLLKSGVEEYKLEVLTSNEKAYNVYLKTGFSVVRKFVCLKTKSAVFSDGILPESVRLEDYIFDEIISKKFPAQEWKPSWQHRLEALLDVREIVRCVCAIRGDDIVGYGLFTGKGNGRIAQIGFTDEMWQGSLPSLLLKKLCTEDECEEYAAINVDETAHKTMDLLERHGFETFIGQYEMKKSFVQNRQ